MMEVILSTVRGKPTDFKVCKQCKNINWRENDECVKCESVLSLDCVPSKEFNENGEGVIKSIDLDYEFYMEEEDMTEAEADDVLMDV